MILAMPGSTSIVFDGNFSWAPDGSHPPSAWTTAPASGSDTGGLCLGLGAPGHQRVLCSGQGVPVPVGAGHPGSHQYSRR